MAIKWDETPQVSTSKIKWDDAPTESIGPVPWQTKVATFLNEAGQFPKAFMNTATFGATDAIDKGLTKLGVPENPYNQEPVTPIGKFGQMAGNFAGFVEGPQKLGLSIGEKILPKAVEKTAGVAPKIFKKAVEGSVMGASNPGSLEERKKNAVFGAVASPIVNAGIEQLEPSSIRIAQGIIKPKGVLAKRSEDIARTSLEKGVLRASAEGTARASQEAIDNLMSQVDDIAQNSNVPISMKPAFQRAAASAKYWISEGKPERAQQIIDEINNLSNAKGWTPRTELPASEYLNARRGQDAVIKKLRPTAFNAPAVSPDIEGRMEFVGGMRKGLGQAIPEIGEKNRDISNLIDVSNAAKQRAKVSSRNNLFDIMDYGIGTTAAATKNPFVLGLGVAKKAWQGSKALAARGMYNAAQTIKKFGVPELEAQDVNFRVPGRISVGESPKLLSREMGPITTSIPNPEFQRSLPIPTPEFQRSFPLPPKQIEQSPIIFGEPASVTKTLTPKKFGINPFTGELKGAKLPSSYQAALNRIKQLKGE